MLSAPSSVLSTRPDTDGLAPWLAEAQSSAWDRFEALPMPTLKNECWRFASLKQLDLGSFAPSPLPEDAADLVERAAQSAISGSSNRIVFANNALIDSSLSDLPDGVIVCPLVEAAEKHSEILRRHFMAQPATLGGEKFAALHAAHTRSGLLVFVPKGVEVEVPIEAFHWVTGEGATTFPHTLVIAEENAKVTLIDHLLSSNKEDPNLSLGNFDLYGAAGAQIEYVSVQDLNTKSTAIQLGTSIAARDANVRSCLVNLGASWARTEQLGRTEGNGANLDMLSATVAGASQVFDQRTYQLHGEQHTTSDLLFKNALFGQSKSIFSGLINVEDGAHHTDAYQTCRNLLMSDEVEANAMPGLEINADQVKCSHGSTSARIGDDEIFYFLARGIDARAARKLISTGFVREAVDKLASEPIVEKIAGLLEARFDRLAS